MRIWIYLNGIQQGPYTLDEIAAMNLLPSTPVWYDGITQWMPASEAPATAVLFGSDPASAEQAAETATANIRESAITASKHVSGSSQDIPPRPRTYMGWSIFATICCCTPGGILAIIFTALTTSNYNQGKYDQAAKMANYAEWTIILSIVIGIIFFPITMAMYL